jgi:hypothetical protein
MEEAVTLLTMGVLGGGRLAFLWRGDDGMQ